MQLYDYMVWQTSPPDPLSRGRGGAGYFNFTNKVIRVPFSGADLISIAELI